MARRIAVAALALGYGIAPAHADPILTPLIATLVSSLGLPASFSLFGISIGTTALLTGLVTTAVGIGLALAFAPRPRMPPPENGVIAVQQNIAYRAFAFGRCRVAGAIMLKEEIASRLVYVAALCSHFADNLESLYLNDDAVNVGPVPAGKFVVGISYTITSVGSTNFTLIGASANTVGVIFTATGIGSGSGNAKTTYLLTGGVQGGADGRYSGNAIYIETRQGLVPETSYSFITSLLTSDWDSSHRGDGQVSIGMLCLGVSAQYFSQTYPYTAPSPSVVGRWAKVFDPRDVSQNPTNSATFKWSANAALNILYFLCFSEFGFKADYATAIAPFLALWTSAADICDEAVALKAGGTEPRYQLGGWTTTEQARVATLLVMLQSCDGFLSRRGAGYVLFVGKYYAPTVFLTDDDIVGVYIQTDVSSEDKVNEATAFWSDPDTGYVTVQTDPIVDASDQVARGGAPRRAQLELTWVQSVGQASRLLKREMFRQGVTLRGSLTLGWSGLNAAYERFVQVNSNSIPFMSGVVIEVRKAVISPKTRTVTVDFILSGLGLDTYDATTDESAPPSIPQRPTTVGLPVPANVSVVAELFTDPTGASSVIFAISWDEPFFNAVPWNVNYVVQWRLTDAGGGTPGPWTQESFTTPTIAAGRVSVQTLSIQSGTSFDVQVASVGTGATLSDWSAIHTVSTVLSNVAPAPPTWVSATGGAGSVELKVTAPASPNVATIQFYQAAAGDPFSAAVALGSPLSVSPNGLLDHTFTGVAAGIYDFWAESLTTASVASAPAGPETATVT